MREVVPLRVGNGEEQQREANHCLIGTFPVKESSHSVYRDSKESYILHNRESALSADLANTLY